MLRNTEICGARKRDGTICHDRAGKGTSHPGEGYCKRHEGYRRVERAKILEEIVRSPQRREQIMQLLDDPDLLSMRAELAEMKLRFWELVDWLLTHYPRDGDADHKSEDDIPTNPMVLDSLRKLLVDLAKVARTVQEMEIGRQHYIHIDVTATIVEALVSVSRKFISDPILQQAFADEVRGVISNNLSRATTRQIASSALARPFSPQSHHDELAGDIVEHVLPIPEEM